MKTPKSLSERLNLVQSMNAQPQTFAYARQELQRPTGMRYAALIAEHDLDRELVIAAMDLMHHCATLPWMKNVARPDADTMLDMIIEGRMPAKPQMIVDFCALFGATPEVMLDKTWLLPAPPELAEAAILALRKAHADNAPAADLRAFLQKQINRAEREASRCVLTYGGETNIDILERVEDIYDYMTTPDDIRLEGTLSSHFRGEALPVLTMHDLWDEALADHANHLHKEVAFCGDMVLNASSRKREVRARESFDGAHKELKAFLEWRADPAVQMFLKWEANRRHIEVHLNDMAKPALMA